MPNLSMTQMGDIYLLLPISDSPQFWWRATTSKSLKDLLRECTVQDDFLFFFVFHALVFSSWNTEYILLLYEFQLLILSSLCLVFRKQVNLSVCWGKKHELTWGQEKKKNTNQEMKLLQASSFPIKITQLFTV